MDSSGSSLISSTNSRESRDETGGQRRVRGDELLLAHLAPEVVRNGGLQSGMVRISSWRAARWATLQNRRLEEQSAGEHDAVDGPGHVALPVNAHGHAALHDEPERPRADVHPPRLDGLGRTDRTASPASRADCYRSRARARTPQRRTLAT